MSTTRDASITAPAHQSAFPTICGPAAAGLVEMLLFYPIEVVSRRLEAHKQPIYMRGTLWSHAFNNFKTAALGGQQPASLSGCFANLFSGFRAAVSYRVIQRGYKYGGQPLVKQFLEQHTGEYCRQQYGDRQARIMLDGSAGLLIGICEAPFLLPLDAVKVRMQVNRQSVNGHGIVQFMLSEGTRLYRGLGVTMTRNAIGAASFFTAYSCAREVMTGRDSAPYLSTWQKLSASTIATMISITLSHPLDVIKTRLQSGLEPAEKGAWQVAAEMIQREGLFSVWKGYFVKIPTAGPRVVFTYALAQTITEALVEWAGSIVHCPPVVSACEEQDAQKPASRR